MRPVFSTLEHPFVLAGDAAQIHQLILDSSWKVSGCGLSQGAFSCAIFMSQYAGLFEHADATAHIQQLFDRGCNGVVSGKTGWLDFADLALVAHRLREQGFVQIEPEDFFEDIDKLALKAIAHPGQIAGFVNSELGAVLYAFRRFNAGAAHFSGPLREFASMLAAGVDLTFAPESGHESQNLRSGFSAPLLMVSALREAGLIGKKETQEGIQMLIDRVFDNGSVVAKMQISTGFQTGELGKGYALLRAGMCFQCDEWIAAAIKILIDCARSVLDRGISTLDMASGAAGIALAFHKLYQLSGYDIFRNAAGKARWLGLKAGAIIDDQNIDQAYSFYHGLSGMGLATLCWHQNQPEQLDELLWLI